MPSASQKRMLQIAEEARKKLASSLEAEEPAPPSPTPWDAQPEHFICARSAVRLLFINGGTPPPESVSVEDVPSKSFEPEYVHQTFEREAIALPTSLRPLRIETVYTNPSLHALIRCNQPMSEAPVEEAMYRLAASFGEGALCADSHALVKANVNVEEIGGTSLGIIKLALIKL